MVGEFEESILDKKFPKTLFINAENKYKKIEGVF